MKKLFKVLLSVIIVTIFNINNSYAQKITAEMLSVKYKTEILDQMFLGKEVALPEEFVVFNVRLINNSAKKIDEVRCSAFFGNRGADPYDFMSPLTMDECDAKVSLSTGYRIDFDMQVPKPHDSDMIFKALVLKTIVFEDGTFIETNNYINFAK